jgi:pyruvate-formate lyase-activating enzyme
MQKTDRQTDRQELPPLILYGAGMRSAWALNECKTMGYKPVCFCDADTNKQGREHLGLPVLSFQKATQEIGDAFVVYITPTGASKYEICAYLDNLGIPKCRIINYEPYEKRVGCPFIEECIVLDKDSILLCCNSDRGVSVPSFAFMGLDDEQCYRKFIEMRRDAIESLNGHGTACKGCDKAKEGYWGTMRTLDKVTLVAFATGFVCQFKCVYCANVQQPFDECLQNIDRMLEFVRYLETNQLISPSAYISIANGEVTINQRFDEILTAFSSYQCGFLTNGQVYRERIAKKLMDGMSFVNVSLDSGTRETFRNVKGADCFHEVCGNIRKYASAGAVQLKYILIPGLNDGDEDIDSFLDFANEIGATVSLARDIFGHENFNDRIDGALKAVTRFLHRASDLGIILYIGQEFYDGAHKDKIRSVIAESRETRARL